MNAQPEPWAPLTQLAEQVQAGVVTATELVDQALSRIAAQPEYGAVLWTLEDRARERAAAIDAAVKQGNTLGALAGVPFIAKDNFLVFGAETTAASNILKGFTAPYQATAIERLEAEGAICVAKANLDAFGHGSSSENSDFQVTKNPHDNTRVPGGSSSGSAAAVVLHFVPFALGTDTGGSSRQPASFSGCFGYKPTYGLISRSGVVAMASSCDTIGVLALRAEDIATVVDVVAGIDPLDATTVPRDSRRYGQMDGTLSRKRVGIIEQYTGEAIQPGVQACTDQAVAALRQAGAEVSPVDLPSLPLALAAYYIIVPAEISSNLSRYDGQRYGFSAVEAANLDQVYSQSRARGFGKEAKRRIMIGTYVLSSGYFDAYYKQAQLVRTKIVNEMAAAFERYDYLVSPAAPTTAFAFGAKTDPLAMYMGDIITVSANMSGVPAISLPAGLSDGLPVGVQLMAASGKDADLIETARLLHAALQEPQRG